MFGTVAVLYPGDMGHGVAAALGAGGRRVVTALAGRSAETRARAERTGIEDLETLEAVVADADLLVSILPPAAALGLAHDVSEAMSCVGRRPTYVDANAVAPTTAAAIADEIAKAGAPFVDGGIIGGSPRPGGKPTRLYVSGPDAASLAALSQEDAGLAIRTVGSEVGQASGLKMAYAALTKGTMTLQAAVLMLARRLGLHEALGAELAQSQPEAWKRMGVLPFLPADAERWVGEMQEIATTFEAADLPRGFHDAAADVFRAMAATPFAAETRETVDRSRTLDQAIEAFLAGHDRGRAS